MFIGVFGVSVNALLIRALGIRSDSFPRRLVREGLVAEHRRLGYPNTLYMLTRLGHEIAEGLLHRKVRLIRGDRLSTSQLAHDLMTQAAVLDSLEDMAQRNSASLDLEAFLLHARDSKDLGAIEQAVRPDLLFERDGRALSWECENYVKSTASIQSKMHMLLRSSTQFKSLTVFWAIRSGSETVARYRACWDRTLEAHYLDGISRQELSRVTCFFKSTTPIRGVR